MRRCLPFLFCTLAVAVASAQDDLRDTLTLRSGKQLTGRVLTPFAVDEVLLLQGGKRVRVARADVVSQALVADRIREFAQRRVRQKDNARAQWFLVEWAAAHGLPGLARAQAMLLVLDDDANEAAHEFLGHKRSGTTWLWERDGKFLDRDKLLGQPAKRPWSITGERFTVIADGDLRANVAALLDLEHLAVFWFDEFGTALQVREALEPMRIQASASVDKFEKWGFRPVPWFKPAPHGDIGLTFFAGPDPTRPRQLFFLGAQALAYRTLIGEGDVGDPRGRVVPWVEIGLGMFCESRMQGSAGFAAPGPLRLQDLQALQALGRDYKLTHLLHLPMYGGFYLLDDTGTAINWNAAAMLVTWLLDENNAPATRTPFLQFVRMALGERIGDSSSLFDRTMGRPIEQLEEPWRKWLEKAAGF